MYNYKKILMINEYENIIKRKFFIKQNLLINTYNI